MVVWMNEQPFAPGRGYVIKQATKMVGGEIAELRYAVDVNTLEKRPARQLGLNEVGHVQLALNQPIVYDAYKTNAATGAFIIIDRLTNNTVGAGMILEAGDVGTSGDHWQQEPASEHLRFRTGEVTLADREARLGQKGVTLLLNGLTGAGKSTLAFALEKKLFDLGYHAMVLSGQNMRHGLSRDLSFTADDRSENVRRAAEVARLLNDAGLIAIGAFVAPHDAVRRKAAEVIGPGRFFEVYLSAPVELCRQREPKTYQLADAGDLQMFPGVSAIFEVPESPALTLAPELSIEESVERVLKLLRDNGVIK
jgi:bifunctional enzyme CysN/CysC